MKSTNQIIELRIFPPIAVARFGSADTPLEAYSVTIDEKDALDFRTIVPEPSYMVNADGTISVAPALDEIQFKVLKDDKLVIKPVAPFLEVFVRTKEDEAHFIPLTLEVLEDCGLQLSDLNFRLTLENHKIFRRTENANDKIYVQLDSSELEHKHAKHALDAQCINFTKGATMNMGHFQFIKPTVDADHKGINQIRFRFTPPHGKVYGADSAFIDEIIAKDVLPEDMNSYLNSLQDYQRIYNSKKGDWTKYKEGEGPTKTNPAQIFAGYDEGDLHYSIGLFDDAGDGFLEVTLNTPQQILKARASLVTAPPAFAPDILPIRVVTDELEQLLYGPDLNENETVYIDDIQEIMRRAFETIRLMNTAMMNGNPYYGIPATASTMPRQDNLNISPDKYHYQSNGTRIFTKTY